MSGIPGNIRFGRRRARSYRDKSPSLERFGFSKGNKTLIHIPTQPSKNGLGHFFLPGVDEDSDDTRSIRPSEEIHGIFPNNSRVEKSEEEKTNLASSFGKRKKLERWKSKRSTSRKVDPGRSPQVDSCDDLRDKLLESRFNNVATSTSSKSDLGGSPQVDSCDDLRDKLLESRFNNVATSTSSKSDLGGSPQVDSCDDLRDKLLESRFNNVCLSTSSKVDPGRSSQVDSCDDLRDKLLENRFNNVATTTSKRVDPGGSPQVDSCDDLRDKLLENRLSIVLMSTDRDDTCSLGKQSVISTATDDGHLSDLNFDSLFHCKEKILEELGECKESSLDRSESVSVKSYLSEESVECLPPKKSKHVNCSTPKLSTVPMSTSSPRKHLMHSTTTDPFQSISPLLAESHSLGLSDVDSVSSCPVDSYCEEDVTIVQGRKKYHRPKRESVQPSDYTSEDDNAMESLKGRRQSSESGSTSSTLRNHSLEYKNGYQGNHIDSSTSTVTGCQNEWSVCSNASGGGSSKEGLGRKRFRSQASAQKDGEVLVKRFHGADYKDDGDAGHQEELWYHSVIEKSGSNDHEWRHDSRADSQRGVDRAHKEGGRSTRSWSRDSISSGRSSRPSREKYRHHSDTPRSQRGRSTRSRSKDSFTSYSLSSGQSERSSRRSRERYRHHSDTPRSRSSMSSGISHRHRSREWKKSEESDTHNQRSRSKRRHYTDSPGWGGSSTVSRDTNSSGWGGSSTASRDRYRSRRRQSRSPSYRSRSRARDNNRSSQSRGDSKKRYPSPWGEDNRGGQVFDYHHQGWYVGSGEDSNSRDTWYHGTNSDYRGSSGDRYITESSRQYGECSRSPSWERECHLGVESDRYPYPYDRDAPYRSSDRMVTVVHRDDSSQGWCDLSNHQQVSRSQGQKNSKKNCKKKSKMAEKRKGQITKKSSKYKNKTVNNNAGKNFSERYMKWKHKEELQELLVISQETQREITLNPSINSEYESPRSDYLLNLLRRRHETKIRMLSQIAEEEGGVSAFSGTGSRKRHRSEGSYLSEAGSLPLYNENYSDGESSVRSTMSGSTLSSVVHDRGYKNNDNGINCKRKKKKMNSGDLQATESLQRTRKGDNVSEMIPQSSDDNSRRSLKVDEKKMKSKSKRKRKNRRRTKSKIGKLKILEKKETIGLTDGKDVTISNNLDNSKGKRREQSLFSPSKRTIETVVRVPAMDIMGSASDKDSFEEEISLYTGQGSKVNDEGQQQGDREVGVCRQNLITLRATPTSESDMDREGDMIQDTLIQKIRQYHENVAQLQMAGDLQSGQDTESQDGEGGTNLGVNSDGSDVKCVRREGEVTKREEEETREEKPGREKGETDEDRSETKRVEVEDVIVIESDDDDTLTEDGKRGEDGCSKDSAMSVVDLDTENTTNDSVIIVSATDVDKDGVTKSDPVTSGDEEMTPENTDVRLDTSQEDETEHGRVSRDFSLIGEEEIFKRVDSEDVEKHSLTDKIEKGKSVVSPLSEVQIRNERSDDKCSSKDINLKTQERTDSTEVLEEKAPCDCAVDTGIGCSHEKCLQTINKKKICTVENPDSDVILKEEKEETVVINTPEEGTLQAKSSSGQTDQVIMISDEEEEDIESMSSHADKIKDNHDSDSVCTIEVLDDTGDTVNISDTGPNNLVLSADTKPDENLDIPDSPEKYCLVSERSQDGNSQKEPAIQETTLRVKYASAEGQVSNPADSKMTSSTSLSNEEVSGLQKQPVYSDLVSTTDERSGLIAMAQGLDGNTNKEEVMTTVRHLDGNTTQMVTPPQDMVTGATECIKDNSNEDGCQTKAQDLNGNTYQDVVTERSKEYWEDISISHASESFIMESCHINQAVEINSQGCGSHVQESMSTLPEGMEIIKESDEDGDVTSDVQVPSSIAMEKESKVISEGSSTDEQNLNADVSATTTSPINEHNKVVQTLCNKQQCWEDASYSQDPSGDFTVESCYIGRNQERKVSICNYSISDSESICEHDSTKSDHSNTTFNLTSDLLGLHTGDTASTREFRKDSQDIQNVKECENQIKSSDSPNICDQGERNDATTGILYQSDLPRVKVTLTECDDSALSDSVKTDHSDVTVDNKTKMSDTDKDVLMVAPSNVGLLQNVIHDKEISCGVQSVVSEAEQSDKKVTDLAITRESEAKSLDKKISTNHEDLLLRLEDLPVVENSISSTGQSDVNMTAGDQVHVCVDELVEEVSSTAIGSKEMEYNDGNDSMERELCNFYAEIGELLTEIKDDVVAEREQNCDVYTEVGKESVKADKKESVDNLPYLCKTSSQEKDCEVVPLNVREHDKVSETDTVEDRFLNEQVSSEKAVCTDRGDSSTEDKVSDNECADTPVCHQPEQYHVDNDLTGTAKTGTDYTNAEGESTQSYPHDVHDHNKVGRAHEMEICGEPTMLDGPLPSRGQCFDEDSKTENAPNDNIEEDCHVDEILNHCSGRRCEPDDVSSSLEVVQTSMIPSLSKELCNHDHTYTSVPGTDNTTETGSTTDSPPGSTPDTAPGSASDIEVGSAGIWETGDSPKVPDHLKKILQQKLNTAEEEYHQDCSVMLAVTNFLLSKDPSLRDRLEHCLKLCLDDLGNLFVSSVQDFTDKVLSENQTQSNRGS